MATRKKAAVAASAPAAATVGTALYEVRLRERLRGQVRGMIDGFVSRDEPWLEFEDILDELWHLASTGKTRS